MAALPEEYVLRMGMRWDWRPILERRVDRALSLYPEDANVFLGFIAIPSLMAMPLSGLPSIQEQERYVTELMRAKGYRFVSSQSFLWIGRRVSYRRDDAKD
jgi:hypothetical protein